MHLVLCMAGVYRRFREAGYALPKFLLPWEGGTILSTILARMLADGAFASVLLVGNRRDAAHRPAIEAILRAQGLPEDALLLIDDTAGQAETAALAVAELDRRSAPGDRRVVFHNIDTVLLGRDYAAIGAALARDDGFIDTFDADSPAYSYVALDDAGLVVDIAEKVVISRHATTGLYGFASMDAYLAAYANCRWPTGERYISTLYRSLIERGARLRADGGGPEARTIVLGTPGEYEAARRSS